jgi:large subunit ribosomal protein L4
VTRLSLRNVRGVQILAEGQLNTRDVLVSDHVVFTQEALDSFVARATGATVTAAATPGAEPTAAASAEQEDDQQ